MRTWMNNHECNDICKKVPMAKDDKLIQKLNNYLNKFLDKSFKEIFNDLQIIMG